MATILLFKALFGSILIQSSAFEHFYYHPSRLRQQYEIFKDKNGTGFLLHRIQEHKLSYIPDNETTLVLMDVGLKKGTSFESFESRVSKLATVPDEILEAATSSNTTLPSFKMNITPWSARVDELMRIEVETFITVFPPTFMIGKPTFVNGFFHGNIVRLKNYNGESYFAAWRNVTLDTINFGLLNSINFTTQLNENLILPNVWNGKLYSQQEARMVLLSDDVIFVICTLRFNSRAPYGQIYGIIKYEDNALHISPPVLVDYNRTQHNKNFVPLFHASSSKLYLMPSLNPLEIITLDPFAINDDHIAPATMVYQGPWIPLPWNEDYGALRGGTPAVFIPNHNLYLAFFHTRVNFLEGGARGVDHYYIGALTFCPQFPFHIHTVSAYPIILDTTWYEGKWFNKVVSYAVYPIGLALERDHEKNGTKVAGMNSSTIGKGLIGVMTMGYRDADGFAVRFNVRKLLASLDYVSHCN